MDMNGQECFHGSWFKSSPDYSVDRCAHVRMQDGVERCVVIVHAKHLSHEYFHVDYVEYDAQGELLGVEPHSTREQQESDTLWEQLHERLTSGSPLSVPE